MKIEHPEIQTTSWTFHKVRLQGFDEDFPCEWMAVISTFQELLDYYYLTQPSRFRAVYEDFVEVQKSKRHYQNHIAQAAATLGEMSDFSFAESVNRLFDKVIKNQLQALHDEKVLYIRSIGSYTTAGSYNVLDEYQSSELVFPHETVRYIQWNNGKHWYAKIGNIDIVVEGEQKWDTKKQAQEAAKIYMANTWKSKGVDTDGRS